MLDARLDNEPRFQGARYCIPTHAVTKTNLPLHVDTPSCASGKPAAELVIRSDLRQVAGDCLMAHTKRPSQEINQFMFVVKLVVEVAHVRIEQDIARYQQGLCAKGDAVASHDA